MCECSNHKKVQEKSISPKYRLADYFETNWESYLSGPHTPLSKEQLKAVAAIRNCRKPTLGADQYVCIGCGELTEICHNCRNRFCPTCSWGDTLKWSAKLESELLDLPHRHVVFTLPHALIPLIKKSGKELLNVLLRTAADTLKDWIEHKYDLKIGVISVLHTFGELKDYHVHTHMIVSWGGISNKTGELIPIKGEYVNYDFLKDKFQIKYEDCMVELFESGFFQDEFSDELSLKRFFRRINNKNWIIHIEPPMVNASAVIRYIGRYSKRACISERKIIEMDGEYIGFQYKDYKIIGTDNKPVEKIERLHYTKFFPRLLQHVPLAYFRLVRYYGLYSTKSKIPSAYLNKKKELSEPQQEWVNPFVCTICDQERVYLYTIFDVRPPKERTGKFDRNIHPSYIYKRA
jgi:hypothetical protein